MDQKDSSVANGEVISSDKLPSPPTTTHNENSQLKATQGTEDKTGEQQSEKPTPKIAPMQSIKIRISEIKHSMGFDDPVKKKRSIVILGGIFGVLILLMVGYALIPRQVAPPLATSTPTPVGTQQPRGEPSEYADDPEVLKIMDALREFDQNADQTKLREDDLRLPTVDWNISF